MSLTDQPQKPRQRRAALTVTRLLEATGQLLEEIGVERISTNLIAERAGVTPPAFYHYFRDKYAIFRELGERLMAAQNALVTIGPGSTPEVIAGVLKAHVDLTRAYPGGVWVTRMLRAIPQLESVRLDSHRALAGQLARGVLALQPAADPKTAMLHCRLIVEIGYAAIEMALDEPGPDTDAIMSAAAHAIKSVEERMAAETAPFADVTPR